MALWSTALLAACSGASVPPAPPGPEAPPSERPRHGGPTAEPEAATPPAGGHAHHRGGHGHGHGHHRFENAEAWAARFEDSSRDAWQRPEVVITALGLDRDDRVADIGAATGYFPVRLARAVPEGRVWGVDIEPDMVRYLNARARNEALDNLFAVLGTPSDPLLPEPVDVILIVNTYHHIESRPDYFRRLRPQLRPGGRLAIVDFRMGELPVGPPDEMKIPPEQVRRELEEAGYRLTTDDAGALPYQFLLIFSVAEPASATAAPTERGDRP